MIGWDELDGLCWNAFCIAGDCDGLHHVDVTGETWTQAEGTAYCPGCRDYVDAAGGCEHFRAVTIIYDREGRL